MSYDLTIRADHDYSRSTPLAALAEFLDQLPHLRRNGPSGFILEAPPARWMNISLELADPQGDSVAVHEAGADQVNCIRLHIPYANLGQEAERDYFPLAFDITQFVGWQLHDAQTGEYITPPAPPDPTRGDFAREAMDTLIEQPAPAPIVEAPAQKPVVKSAAKPKKKPAAAKPKKATAKVAKPKAARKPAAKAAVKQKKTVKAKAKPAAKVKAKPAAKAKAKAAAKAKATKKKPTRR
jgi:hypothetical protein